MIRSGFLFFLFIKKKIPGLLGRKYRVWEVGITLFKILWLSKILTSEREIITQKYLFSLVDFYRWTLELFSNNYLGSNKISWDFDWNCVKSMNDFIQHGHFNSTELFHSGTWYVSTSFLGHSCLAVKLFSSYKAFTFFVNVILKYVIFLKKFFIFVLAISHGM